MIVLADTSPLNYLVLIGHVGILPVLFREVIIPTAVRAELQHPGTPQTVREWIDAPPAWIEVRSPRNLQPGLSLGNGEIEAISLAMELHADLLLIDDRLGRRAAESRSIAVLERSTSWRPLRSAT